MTKHNAHLFKTTLSDPARHSLQEKRGPGPNALAHLFGGRMLLEVHAQSTFHFTKCDHLNLTYALADTHGGTPAADSR